LILPGATLGMLGSGQLGRMFAIAAARLGYRTVVLAETPDDPAAQIAHQTFLTGDDPVQAAAEFARHCAVITLEFENIDPEVAAAAAAHAPLHPGVPVLRIAQDRGEERDFLDSIGAPTARHRIVSTPAEADAAHAALGPDLIFKTCRSGYDGKGQARLTAATDAAQVFESLGGARCLAEAVVPFERELSVILARSTSGETAVYAPFHNVHRNHILDVTEWPAPDLPDGVARRAEELARAIATGLDMVGVLCVEMFLESDGTLLINELAPRPHNSGHVTIEAAWTDQFEQQVRAVTGLPLGSTEPRQSGAMVNLLGDVYSGGTPDWARAVACPTARLHLYGKRDARPGRKMGHLTVLDADARVAAATARQLREQLN
jgi:5-(carboxyamino)imidazole ribonucleotide synthase